MTKEPEYVIDLNQYTGVYDGVIIKSMYSKFKSNASNGYKIAFMINEPESIDENDISVTMSDLDLHLSIGATFKELNKSSVTSIKYKGNEIKPQVSGLSVVTSTIVKEGSNDSITPDKVTASAGTYKITYTVSFKYLKTPINKVLTQTVIVE